MAATITWTKAELLNLDSSLSLTDDEFAFWSAEAANEIGEDDRFGDQQNFAGLLLTAHYVSANPAFTAAMPVMKESALGSQGVSVQYAIRTFSATDLSLSRYGIMYQRLLNRYCRGGFLVP